MSRNEFLKNLREALELSLEKDAINTQIDYYDKYISDEVAKGRSEKEVIDELGDPRLIAKTIKTVSGSDNIINEPYNNADENKSYSNSSNNGDSSNANKGKGYVYSTSGISCVILFLVLIIFIGLILRLFGFMLFGVTSIISNTGLGFIILILLLVWLVIRRR